MKFKRKVSFAGVRAKARRAKKARRGTKRKNLEGTVFTPRSVRLRTDLPTPPSTGRRLFRAARDIGSAGASALAGPYAGMAVEAVGRGTEYAYDRLTSGSRSGRKGNSKVSYVNGVMSGKYRSVGKPINRKRYGKKGGLTKFGMAQKGITYREEYRDPDPIVTNRESMIIGHCSLPEQATLYNVFRSLLKCLFVKGGAHVDSLTTATGMSTSGTQIKVKWYPSITAIALETWTYNIDPATDSTWQKLFDNFLDSFLVGVIDIYASNMDQIRWVEIELLPSATWNQTTYQRVRMSLPYLNVEIRSKSCLKLQNQSGVWAAEDPETNEPPNTDDVNAIPVECNMYYAKGNNLVHQNRRTMLSLGFGGLGRFQTYAQNEVGAEPAPSYEYVNCSGKDKFNVDPGHIKTSIISHKQIYKFPQIIRLLLCRTPYIAGGTTVTFRNSFVTGNYVPGLGHFRGLHIDRVIGSKTGSVRIMTEFELTQQIACYGPQNTATDEYDVQRPT